MKKLIYAVLLLGLLLLPAGSAYAMTTSPLDGRVVLGQDFTLKNGDTLQGDLVVIGGQATIENGAIVNGDIVIIGGSLQLNGQGTGDAVVIGGFASMGTSGSLVGNMVTMGGSLQKADGAVIHGNIITNLPAPTIQSAPSGPQSPPKPNFDFVFNPVWKAANIFFQALILGALAMLLTVFLHPQLERVAQAIVGRPLMAGSLGLLSAVGSLTALILLVVVLAVTLILIPIALLAVIVWATLIVLAWLFGILALGMEVGDRFTKAINQSWAPVLSAGFGTFLLAIVVGALNQVPCIGWMTGVLVGLIGIGAVVMTMFGTRPFLPPGTIDLAPQPGPTQSAPPAG